MNTPSVLRGPLGDVLGPMMHPENLAHVSEVNFRVLGDTLAKILMLGIKKRLHVAVFGYAN